LISICTKEPTYNIAKTAISEYASNNWEFHAPNVIVPEFLYILCQKLQNGLLTEAEYRNAIQSFKNQMAATITPTGGDISLIDRAIAIQATYGCSRSADCLYIALAEVLAKSGPAELLTFDNGNVNQTTKHAPTVKVNLLSTF
jgi:predicted nucleic acid-binding protein